MLNIKIKLLILLIFIKMDFLREIVSGPKKRMT